MNPKLKKFCQEYNINSWDGSFLEADKQGVLDLVYPHVDESLLEKSISLSINSNSQGDCNFCPSRIKVPPQLPQAGWGVGLDNQFISLHAIDIEEFDMPVGSFCVILNNDLGGLIGIRGRNYLPSELGTEYFVESVHEDAQNLVQELSKTLELSTENAEHTKPVKVLGKMIGYRTVNSASCKCFQQNV